MEYLGFCKTHDGVTPINNKTEAITNMKPHTFQKEVRNFMSEINYYPDMWTVRSHTLAPLTISTSIKRKFEWTQVEQDTFGQIK